LDLKIDSKIKLNNGIEMPRFGLGTWALGGNEAYQAVLGALNIGYRLIDTAMIYGNEREIGNALKDAKLSRDEIFITTKVWNYDQGYENTLKAFTKSLGRLKLDYIDLYLIHWPATPLRNESWRALERIYNERKARSVGVSNFTIRHLNELLQSSSIIPTINQFELSPFLYQKDLIEYCQEKGIVVEAYSPLTRGRKLDNEMLQNISRKYQKTPAQILLRWGLQHNFVEIPKSGSIEHLKENANIFDFTIDKNDMTNLDNLNEGFRLGQDPHLIN
jgi:diketogulonate reductase-like aldo/keto reductase